jgi:Polyketide cyclase / dehydrase and lipid transport
VSVVTATVDVAVPIRTAYNHWTRVEELPTFLGELEQACMVADRTMRWKVKLGATTREFDMLLTEQVSDERVAWAWTEKSQHFATITFGRLDNAHTCERGAGARHGAAEDVAHPSWRGRYSQQQAQRLPAPVPRFRWRARQRRKPSNQPPAVATGRRLPATRLGRVLYVASCSCRTRGVSTGGSWLVCSCVTCPAGNGGLSVDGESTTIIRKG